MSIAVSPAPRPAGRRTSGVLVMLALSMLPAPIAGQSPRASARPVDAVAAPRARTLLALTAQSLVNIYGRAIDATKEGVPGAHMRLRNARTGRIVADATTDRNGDFEFLGIDPGMYVPEMVSQSGRLIAAGEMLVVEYGQTVATIVRLPVKLSLYNLMRDSSAMTEALEQNAVAAASGAAAQAGVAASGTVSPNIFAPTIGTILNVVTSAGILTRIPEGPAASARQ